MKEPMEILDEVSDVMRDGHEDVALCGGMAAFALKHHFKTHIDPIYTLDADLAIDGKKHHPKYAVGKKTLWEKLRAKGFEQRVKALPVSDATGEVKYQKPAMTTGKKAPGRMLKIYSSRSNRDSKACRFPEVLKRSLLNPGNSSKKDGRSKMTTHPKPNMKGVSCDIKSKLDEALQPLLKGYVRNSPQGSQ